MGSDNEISWYGIAVFMAAMAMVVFVGCGGEDTSCEDVVCESGQSCIDGACVDNGSICEPRCEPGEECRDRRCVAQGGGCDYQGQACVAEEFLSWDDGYLCMDWEGGAGREAVCSRDCRTQGCPQGSQCFIVTAAGTSSCDSDATCSEREFCYQGQCAMAACRPPECDAGAGMASGCPGGQRCAALGDSADICVPAGSRQTGESCIGAARAYQEQRLDEGCVEEAACVGGICHDFCDDGECEHPDRECVSSPIGETGTQAGLCLSTCNPGDGDCGSSETCVPTSGGDGSCQRAGSIEAFEACSPGGEGCEPGTICAAQESGEDFGRCLPVCDLSVAAAGEGGEISASTQSVRDDTCPQPETPQAVWMIWHLAEAGPTVDVYLDGQSNPVAQVEGGDFVEFDQDQIYEQRDGGRIDWEVRQAGAPSTDVPIAEGSFVLEAATTRTLALVPEPGRDHNLESYVVDMQQLDSVQWVQAIPDLEPVDLWAVDDTGQATKWVSGLTAGQSVAQNVEAGVYDLRLLAQGDPEQGDPLVIFSAVEFEGDETFVAFSGTMDPGDIHSVASPILSADEVADVEQEMGLSLSCRPVNGGAVGACIEKCGQGASSLAPGRCAGQNMGCGPRRFEARNKWSTVCQPVGDLEEGQSCAPTAERPCAEGLYCEQVGPGDSAASTGGRCARLCPVTDESWCGQGRGCRLMLGAEDYDVGQCRPECSPDGNYEDQSCPSHQRSCIPEARLVPSAGDGYQVEDQQPFCWASGAAGIGESCTPGACEPGGECIFERSVQFGFVESMLSPYFPDGSPAPTCRAICDPFTDERSNHQCSPEQTCLFNYPWNANVGHCADIDEGHDIGQPCDDPGLACGPDSICVMESGSSECVRFCQFVGQGSGGYQRSTCPLGFECRPLVNDIGVCR